MNDPPDHTAEFSAANLLSLGGISFPKYSLTKSGWSRSAESMSVNRTPMSSSSSLILWYTTSDSYCADTPPRYFFSASGIPSLSQVPSFRLEDGVVGVLPAEPVPLRQLLEVLFLGDSHDDPLRSGPRVRPSHARIPTARVESLLQR